MPASRSMLCAAGASSSAAPSPPPAAAAMRPSPSASPATSGRDRAKPKRVPEAIAITVALPGVMVAMAAKSSSGQILSMR